MNAARLFCLGLSGLGSAQLLGCGGQLDAGFDTPHGPLPVDERSAMIVTNDGSRDNWQAEYAAVLASTGRLKLVGFIVNSSAEYPQIETNVAELRRMVTAARASGMRNLPDPTASIAPALIRPESGRVEDTVANRSEGARLIVEAAARYGTLAHPLAIATGGALTDVADAYLLDPTLPERSVVVASLGQVEGGGARAGDPNGIRDPWATEIVTTFMRYVQVNGFYDQLLDVPESRVDELPANAFGAWMTEKRADILELTVACDQVSVLAAALPWFATDVTRMRLDDGDRTLLVSDPGGPLWHVAGSEHERAREELWLALRNPQTFGQ